MICDFCSSEKIRWHYPAKTFSFPSLSWQSEEGWIACHQCSQLIEEGQIEALAQRSADGFRREHGLIESSRELVVLHMRELHALFRANRLGPREEIA